MHRLGAALAALMIGLWAPHAHAATYDPELTWRTIVTEHFRIHFHQGEEQVADEFSLMVEDVFDTMTAEIAWVPRGRTEIVLVDRTDIANGYASSVPYRQIVIYVTGPQEDSTLALYEDWSSAIFTHELTHILHLETNHGIVRAARAVVGRIASTNTLSPLWMVEGFATFQETRHTPGGRGRTPAVDMIKRTAVVDDAFPPLGNMDGFQPKPPAGNLRYLFGQDFIQYVADTRGEDVWTRWAHVYGSSIPFILPSKKVFGRRLVPMYFEWRDAVEARYAAELAPVEAEGIREGRLISDPAASCSAPSFAPDNEKLVWSCYDLKRGSAIWMSDGQGENAEVLLKDRGAKNFTWRADSKAFVYAASHIINRFNVWSDVYMHVLDGGTRPLTRGARARDPDFSPDGSRLAVVTNRAQDTQLEVLTIDQRQQALTDRHDHAQFATPRFSPDGRAIAVSVWEDGRRDLWLYTAEGEPSRRLTYDAAIDRDPEWSADGRYLFFSSDRTGIPNVFAIDTRDEHLWQVTNVRTGAARPSVSPDGLRLAYEQYSADGWDVRLMDLDPAQWLDRGFLSADLAYDAPIAALTDLIDAPITPTPEATAAWWPDEDSPPARPGAPFVPPLPGLALDRQDTDAIDTFEQTDVKGIFGEEEDYPFAIQPRRYNPLPTLLPRYWLPYVQTTPVAPMAPFDFLPWGLQLTAATGASDTLRHYAWDASASYRTDANFLGWSGSFTLNRYLPVFTVSGSSRAIPFGNLYRLDPETGEPDPARDGDFYWERRIVGAVTMAYPFTPRSTFFARYSITHRKELRDIPSDTWLAGVPIRGTIGQLSAGWRYSWSQQTAYSISREDARIISIVGSVLAPWLGTFVKDENGELQGRTQGRLTAEIREYVVNPWVPNHVLAMRLAGGVTLGGQDFFGNYQLGGSFGDSAFYVTPDEFRMLRGHPFGADIGDMYWLTGAEYRFPIWRFDRGVGTIPVFLRALSGSVFVDAGNAFTEVQTVGDVFEDSLVGVGAELTLSTVLGWRSGFTGRLGYAVGLTGQGYAPNDPRTVYFQLGGSF